MTTSQSDLTTLKAELKSLILSVANLQSVSAAQIADEEPLFHDGLGLDSIDLLEIVVHLDKKYGLKLKNDEEGRQALRNVQSLASTLQLHLAAK